MEVIRRELADKLTGEVIKKTEILSPGVIAYPSEEQFCLQIKGRVIEGFLRKGKFLIIALSGPLKLAVHLRMTGTLTYLKDVSDKAVDKYARALIYPESGGVVCFSDIRKFGRLWLLQPGEEYIAGLHKLGPDWWNEATPGLFRERLISRPKSPLKTLLLDQGFLAGLGNIYTDESLYRACIHPATTAGCLTNSQIRHLFKIIRDTLAEGIKQGGTSIRDYRNAGGNPGGFQDRLLVYQRKGKICTHCTCIIQRTKLAGRGTYYCPGCQKQKSEVGSRKSE